MLVDIELLDDNRNIDAILFVYVFACSLNKKKTHIHLIMIYTPTVYYDVNGKIICYLNTSIYKNINNY